MKLHNRQIKASFWTDTKMIRNFTLEERLFYIGLWQLADDSGCVENDPYAFKLFLFPLNDSVTIENLNDWTTKLIEKNNLIPYHTQGKDGLYLANFHKHQTIKNPQPPIVPLLPWITWKPYKSNLRTGRYEIDDPHNHQEIHHPKDSQESQDSFLSSYTFLTPFLQYKYKENLNRNRNINKKEPKEGRDCQGKGEDLSANAESRLVHKGENIDLKESKDLKMNDPNIDTHKANDPKPNTDKSNLAPQTIMDFYNQEFEGLWKGPLRLTRERERQIKARLKSFTVEELKTAITNLRQSAFHCGNNDKERVYGTPEYLFKNDSQVDKWLNEKPQTPGFDQKKIWSDYIAKSKAMNDFWLGVKL